MEVTKGREKLLLPPQWSDVRHIGTVDEREVKSTKTESSK
jgi:hypothetical protein